MTTKTAQKKIRGASKNGATRQLGKLEQLAYRRDTQDRKPRGRRRGLWFDDVAADKAVRFFEEHLHHCKGEWTGRLFLLEDWEKFIIRSIFGWRRKDGTRRFRRVYIEVPKKNGKSTLAGGVALYLLVADGEYGAEIYAAATKRAQAKIVHESAKEMVRASPALARWCEVLSNNINVKRMGSKFEPLGADFSERYTTQHGLNVHAAIMDELSFHRDRTVLDALETGKAARRQPLTFMITTAGVYDITSIGWEEHDHAVKVLEGSMEDDELFTVIFAADEKDDWTDPATWWKANPNMGVSVKRAFISAVCDQAQRSPSFQNTFLRLHLGRWTQALTRWLPMDKWMKCSKEPPDAAGLKVWCGLDLASTIDLAALAVVFRDPEDPQKVGVIWRYWCPQERIMERSQTDRVPYDAWARDGWITATPGDVIDYAYIKAEILELAQLMNIQEIAFDRWNASELVNSLMERGLTMVQFGQGYQSMSAPTKELERLVTAKALLHGNNPVSTWMAGNVMARSDEAGNIKPDRKRSTEKIDGMVAMIMGLGRMVVAIGNTWEYGAV